MNTYCMDIAKMTNMENLSEVAWPTFAKLKEPAEVILNVDSRQPTKLLLIQLFGIVHYELFLLEKQLLGELASNYNIDSNLSRIKDYNSLETELNKVAAELTKVPKVKFAVREN